MTSTIYNRLMIGASLAAIALPAHARDSAEDIIVTAQKQNQTAVLRGGSVGVFGDKAAEDTPFSIKTYNEALILNQQPQTLGQVLENDPRSEEHTSELQSLMRISYAVFCLKKKKKTNNQTCEQHYHLHINTTSKHI